MNSRYKVKAFSLMVVLCVTFPATLLSQENKSKDKDLNREMTLEREYDPTVQDASKVNTLPKVKEPVVKKMPIDYSIYSLPFDVQPEIYLLKSGSVMTGIPHNNRRGYFNLGVGTYMNLNGDLGYHILSSEKDKLNVFLSHRSTNGDINYLQSSDRQNAKLSDLLGGFSFEHKLEKMVMKLGFGAAHSSFNYYGYAVAPVDYTLLPLSVNLVDYDAKQGQTFINGMFGLESKGENPFEYALDLGFKRFSNKEGMTGGLGGVIENTLGLDFDINSSFNGGMKIGIEGETEYFNYGETEALNLEPVERNNHLEATLSPYLKMDGENWNVRLGANTMIITGKEKKIFFSPNLSADIEVAPKTVLYATATGKASANSAYEISRENRYINPDLVLEASRTWLDGTIGFKSGIASGFWFDVFAGYKATDNEHFYIPQISPYSQFGNVSNVAYYNSKLANIGAALKYSYQQLFNMSLKGVYNSWKVSEIEKAEEGAMGEKAEAYGKPNFELKGEASVKPMDNITLSMDYYLGAGRTTRLFGSNVKMDNISDLNVKGAYQLNDTFGAYLKFNNILFSKYEMFYGYPMQGFNAMVGINLNF